MFCVFPGTASPVLLSRCLRLTLFEQNRYRWPQCLWHHCLRAWMHHAVLSHFRKYIRETRLKVLPCELVFLHRPKALNNSRQCLVVLWICKKIAPLLYRPQSCARQAHINARNRHEFHGQFRTDPLRHLAVMHHARHISQLRFHIAKPKSFIYAAADRQVRKTVDFRHTLKWNVHLRDESLPEKIACFFFPCRFLFSTSTRNKPIKMFVVRKRREITEH